MQTKQFQFKTNLNCGNCVSKVQNELDNAPNIQEWSVDTDNPEKILTVTADENAQETIETIVKSKGFLIEII
ncbi:hypothetical protein BPO_0473 [Bergeyella porcorum]|uniref:HMA domain-containing protein n=1 Tax=Bergeyella porcorum TaxID=1735111 RepID=A0AAU0EZH6_9FLAO